MPRYIGYEFTGTANSTVVLPSYYEKVELLLKGEGSDASTTFIDDSIRNRSVDSLVGAVQIDTAQFKFGSSSILFDGTDDFIRYGGSTGFEFTGVFTIDTWFRTGTSGTNLSIIGTSNESAWTGDGYYVFVNNDTFSLYRNGSLNDTFVAGATIADSTWHHWHMTRHANNAVEMGLDGTSLGFSTTAETGNFGNTSFRLAIGSAEPTGGAQPEWNGHMDHFRITKGTTLFNGTYTVPTESDYNYIFDKKYNSGVWAINGTGESSVYGRRIEGNWLTTLRSQGLGPPITAQILVVAGGGAGASAAPISYYRGGGGAGGYRAFTDVSILSGTNYTVVVGAGGAVAMSGSPSSLSGPNLPAPSYTSTGGGHGEGVPSPGGPGTGGSGGGLPGYQPSPQKAGNTPPTSPPQGNPGGVGSGYGAGAGGGAGGAGGAGSGNGKGGNGGPGLTWPHSGSTYAGGGGGGNGQGDPGSFGAGGPGGGGRGSGGGGGSGGQNAVPGTINTGGGGGGRTRPGQTAGNGGSGIVIIAVDPLDAPRLSGGTPSTAPTPAGGKTLFTFTSPETLTVT